MNPFLLPLSESQTETNPLCWLFQLGGSVHLDPDMRVWSLSDYFLFLIFLFPNGQECLIHHIDRLPV